MDSVASRGEIDTWLGSAFATWFNERFHVEAGASCGEQSYDNSRLLIVGATERTAISGHRGDAWTAFIDWHASVAYGYDFGIDDAHTFARAATAQSMSAICPRRGDRVASSLARATHDAT